MTIAPSPLLNAFIRAEIERCEAAVKPIPKQEADGAALDRLFRKIAFA